MGCGQGWGWEVGQRMSGEYGEMEIGKGLLGLWDQTGVLV